MRRVIELRRMRELSRVRRGVVGGRRYVDELVSGYMWSVGMVLEMRKIIQHQL